MLVNGHVIACVDEDNKHWLHLNPMKIKGPLRIYNYITTPKTYTIIYLNIICIYNLLICYFVRHILVAIIY